MNSSWKETHWLCFIVCNHRRSSFQKIIAMQLISKYILVKKRRERRDNFMHTATPHLAPKTYRIYFIKAEARSFSSFSKYNMIKP